MLLIGCTVHACRVPAAHECERSHQHHPCRLLSVRRAGLRKNVSSGKVSGWVSTHSAYSVHAQLKRCP